MTVDIESQTMELLTATVEDEKKSITYRWLSRSMGYSVNVAKRLMEVYVITAGYGKAHATYYISRQDSATGNKTISLISQEELEGAKNDSAVTGYHIYSLEPSPLKDISTLSVANAEAIQLQQAKDVNQYRFIKNLDAVVTKSGLRPAASTSSKPSSANKPATTGPSTKPTATANSTSTAPTTASTSAPLSSAPTTAATPAKSAPAKTSVKNFFGKAASAAPKATSAPSPAPPAAPPAAKNTKAPSTPFFKASGVKNSAPVSHKRKADLMVVDGEDHPKDSDSDEADSEDERDRRLALSSRLDQDQGDIHKTADSSKSSLNADILKKRYRSSKLLAIDDDDEVEGAANTIKHSNGAMEDDEDKDLPKPTKEDRAALEAEKNAQRLALENMMLMDHTDHEEHPQDEDSPMIDVEALDEAPSATTNTTAGSASSTTDEVRRNEQGQLVRRRRGTRAVTKRRTTQNERGYLVTEDIVEMEPFSEDEIIPEKHTAPPTPAPRAPASSENTDKKAAPKKKGASGNQSLLNFFRKQ
ncbi:DNA polymerase delta subunit 3 [Lunasporangiospora selenospora]|uniref:DNA polymerase delta subunit 3 n=1 Tax=Lunasporangiospora selenospora TaxID=979761 RepID=A0A9P6KGA9_9FUNG|nr:DNA polymerase delta subunit 3 [Lunasporangiospora selenospora]